MYTDADLARADKTKSQRLGVAFSMLGVGLCLMIVGLIIRVELLSTIGLAAFGCIFYAVLELFAMPYVRYSRFLHDIQNGLSRETDAEFVSASSQPRLNSGVMFYDFIVQVGSDEMDERLFYFDADKPLPAIEPGRPLHITSFGNFITNIESNGQQLC